MICIKKYEKNRKFYNKNKSKYITLNNILDYTINNDPFKVVLHKVNGDEIDITKETILKAMSKKVNKLDISLTKINNFVRTSIK